MLRARPRSASICGFLYQDEAFQVPPLAESYISPIQFSGSTKYVLIQWIHISGGLSTVFVEAKMVGNIDLTMLSSIPSFARSLWKSRAAWTVGSRGAWTCTSMGRSIL